LSVLLVLLFCFQTGQAEWTKQSTGTLSWLKDIFFLDNTKGWIVGSGGMMLSTIDGGHNWSKNSKLTSDTLVQIYFANEKTGWLLCERNI